MSLADYLGPIILLALLGLAFVGGVFAWARFYLVPKWHGLVASLKVDQDLIAYNVRSQALVTSILNDKLVCGTLPDEIMNQVWELNGLHIDTRKGISR